MLPREVTWPPKKKQKKATWKRRETKPTGGENHRVVLIKWGSKEVLPATSSRKGWEFLGRQVCDVKEGGKKRGREGTVK